MKKITVIIPNFNGMKYLRGCLSSLRRQTEQDFDVYLIDNGSEDGSTAYVREHFPEVKIRAYHRNTGFCHAVNAGIRLADTPYVILLNNDTVCDEHMVEELRLALEREDLSGGKRFSCAAKLVSLSDPARLDGAGDYVCALGWAFARGRDRSSALFTREQECFACCGAAAIYRRDVLLRLGLFDEKHYAYLEDIDIGWRAQLAGWHNVYAPGAIVYHAGSATSGSRHNAFKVRLSARNSVYMIWKNMPLWQRMLNGPCLAGGVLIKAGYFTARGLGKEYLTGLLSGFTMCRKAASAKRPFCRSAGGDIVSDRGTLHSQLRIQSELMEGLFIRLRDAAGVHDAAAR